MQEKVKAASAQPVPSGPKELILIESGMRAKLVALRLVFRVDQAERIEPEL